MTWPCAGDAGQCGDQAAQVQGAGARPQPGDQRRHHRRHHRQAAVRAGRGSGALVYRAPVVCGVMGSLEVSTKLRAFSEYYENVAKFP